MDEQQARAWLSEPRYGRLLDAAGGDHERAVTLYEWHAELTIASFGLIHHFEVLLRNTVDGILGADQPQTPIKDTWLLDFEILQPDGIKQAIVAIERLEKGKLVTRGRVVAGVSFRFWAGLFGRRYEELWRHRLRAAFPHAALTRKDLSSRTEGERFELSVRQSDAQRLSRAPHSTALPPLQGNILKAIRSMRSEAYGRTVWR